MKYLTLLVALFIASNSFSCVREIDVTEETIDTIPILGFLHETNGVFSCSLYFRDTGPLKGLKEVSISVRDGSEDQQFAASLEIMKGYSVSELRSVVFTISSENMNHSKLLLSTYVEEISDQGGIHCCRNYYHLSTDLVRRRFIDNPFGFTNGSHELDSKIMNDFLNEKFKPGTGATAKTPVKSGTDQGTMTEL